MSKKTNAFNYKYFIHPKEEMKSLYFDKLLINGIYHCLRLNPQCQIKIEKDPTNLFDNRNKHMEACLDKYFALHSIFDDELFNNLKK